VKEDLTVTTNVHLPVERPPCDWDSPPNPTLNVWTTVNLAEVFPGVAWPLDASWYHRWQTEYLRRAFRQLDVADVIPLYEWPIPNFLGFFAGQCAANVALTTAMVSTYQVDGGSSAVEQFFTADEPGGARATAGTDPARALRTRRRFFGALSQMPRAALADQRRTQELAGRVDALDTAACPEYLLRRWLDRVEEMAQQTFFHHAITSLGAAEYSSLLQDHLRAWVPGLPEDAVTTLTSGLGEVESARPLQALWELSRWVRSHEAVADAIRELPVDELRRRLANPRAPDWRALAELFREFLRCYGFRGQTEWMLARPDWAEDPTFPLNSLRNMVSAPDSGGPSQLARAVAAQRSRAEADYRDALPPRQQRRYDDLLARTQKYVRLREFTKANCIRGVRPGRTIVLALGEHFQHRGLMEQPEDVFFLMAGEVDTAIGGSVDTTAIREIVDRRRGQKESLEGYVLPDNFVGEPVITRRLVACEAETATLTGLAVSPGVAKGRARVVRSIEEANAVVIEPGDVLVAPFTDAPWTPLFLVASAVVVETGGILSHAATVAREFGIPAVVMVKDATRLIADGQTVTVDGSAGQVKLQ
jgi:pyruvate,water dikinase